MDLATLVRRRLDGTFEVDPWGLDADLLDALQPLAALRWHASIEGAELLPDDGPAVLLAPRRLVAPASEAAAIVIAVLRETGRVVRALGIPDVEPIGSSLRRLGGAVDHPAEAAALVRAGNVVLARQPLDVSVPVLHVRTRGWELGRRWRITISR